MSDDGLIAIIVGSFVFALGVLFLAFIALYLLSLYVRRLWIPPWQRVETSSHGVQTTAEDLEMMKSDDKGSKFVEQLELLSQFVPNFVFHPSERYYPVSIDFLLSNSELWFDDRMIAEKGSTTTENLTTIEVQGSHSTRVKDNKFRVVPMSGAYIGQMEELEFVPVYADFRVAERIGQAKPSSGDALTAEWDDKARSADGQGLTVSLVTQLLYVVAFAYSERPNSGASSHNDDGPTVAFHHVAIELDNETRRVTRVHLSAHGHGHGHAAATRSASSSSDLRGGVWHSAHSVAFGGEGGKHPMLFVAPRTHEFLVDRKSLTRPDQPQRLGTFSKMRQSMGFISTPVITAPAADAEPAEMPSPTSWGRQLAENGEGGHGWAPGASSLVPIMQPRPKWLNYKGLWGTEPGPLAQPWAFTSM
eukprot:TRINITY_DN941_c0_g1_i8.p1 TRINITY_DN941_c0_g1~~TRINITY_DN941_c0_g1_i8.p1  ORF type:complete len:427 (+),score=64.24 TRINITY_DN941_c0_g1_i8:28-1281(+)